MTASNKWYWFSIILVSGFLVYLLAPVLTPFLIAAILAYIGDPIVDRLETYKIPRTLAVAIVFIVLTLITVIAFIFFIPMLEKQISILINKLPSYVQILQTKFVPWLNERLGIELEINAETIQASMQGHWKEAGGIASTALAYATRSGALILAFVGNLVLVPVVTFYLLRDWDNLVARVRELLPRQSEPVISSLAKQSDEVLGSFLRGQILVMLALAVIYSVGLGIIGLDLALLIGVIAGLVSFVPYLGFIIGIAIATVAAIFQFNDVIHVFYVVIVFAVGQMAEGMFLTPKLVGDRIGLHPVAVIFAVLAGGQLFGFVGVLLALPLAAVIAVILRYLHEQYKSSSMYAG